ncbi:MAG: hypothetical protein JJ714_10685 [Acidithiobacillus sp.]|nr:hypothetical protein [Acidithiobacillus sp.]
MRTQFSISDIPVCITASSGQGTIYIELAHGMVTITINKKEEAKKLQRELSKAISRAWRDDQQDDQNFMTV